MVKTKIGFRSVGLALILALQGCTAATDNGASLRGSWRVERLEGQEVLKDHPARLDFQSDGRVTGSATCNHIIGTYQTSDQTLSFSPLATSRRLCPGAMMAQERRLLDALARASRYRIDAGQLILLDSQGRELLRARTCLSCLPARPKGAPDSYRGQQA